MACVFLVWRVRTIACSVTFPIAIAECTKPLTVRIVLENRSFLPCQRFQCRVELGNRFLKKKKKRWKREREKIGRIAAEQFVKGNVE